MKYFEFNLKISYKNNYCYHLVYLININLLILNYVIGIYFI